MVGEAYEPPPGQEGLQYLCSKYSSLITKLREEVLARQQAEGEARLYERRLREEASLREVERRQWEEERRALHDELIVLRAWRQDADGSRSVEANELQRAAVTTHHLSARCDQLHEACAEEAQRTQKALHQAAAGSEVLSRQGEELAKLRREHAEHLASSRDAAAELAACREHLSRWRHAAGDLEGRLQLATGARDEAETRARHLQEEMRQALRSASVARAREAASANCAGRGQRELRSREARLSTLRKEGQRYAQRASSAEKRLRVAESYEVAATRLGRENQDLRLRLEAETRALENVRVDMARAEAGEARSAAGAGEFQSELRAKETLAAAARQRCAELDGELAHARSRLEQLEGERASHGGTVEGLRSELKVSREEREESQRQRDKSAAELTEARRRLDRGTPQLQECRRRLQHAEEAAAKAGADAAEERRARERCHTEAIRLGEKLRLARSQCSQLRERVRALEEVELRYPSRLLGEVAPPLLEALTPSPPRSPRSGLHAPASARSGSGCVDLVKEFVAREDERLPTWTPLNLADKAVLGESAMFEEPRSALPSQSEGPVARRADVLQAGFSPSGGAVSSTAGSRAAAALHTGSALEASGVKEGELAALLAAEPRVLKLPEPLKLSSQAGFEPPARPVADATLAGGG